MFNRYFQQELETLKELGAEFSKAHPAVAPMLSGRSSDPDVDRLLEGVAFLTALLKQKLDDEFPEIVHELIRLLWPHYLRPLPSASIVAFKPKPSLKQSLTIPAGIHVASTPVEGTSCLFQTCYPVDVHPLNILETSFEETAGRRPNIRLTLGLQGQSLGDWQPESLRFFLGGDFPSASDLYLLLGYYLKNISISSSDKGETVILSPENLHPFGFGQDEGIIPYPPNSFPGYRTIQEYFLLPEKFLFLDLIGWEKWKDRGKSNKFEIRFEFDELPFPAPRIKKDAFVLSATPVVNIFPHSADPIRLDHRKTEYRIRPSGHEKSHYQVYDVQKVVGYVQGTAEERVYVPSEQFNVAQDKNPAYHISIRNSPIRQDFDVSLSIAYNSESRRPVSETLSIDLLCTNGFLTEELKPGDISESTVSTPEQVEFTNLHPPTSTILPPLGTDLLWRLISHLSLNSVSLANKENLRTMLELYLFKNPMRPEYFAANKRRLAGIEEVRSHGVDRLVSGIMMRGREIELRARHDHFGSQGDLFLFCQVLDHFFGSYASINSYTKLVLKEIITGDIYRWPEKLGDHPLI
jgi:type VI secretion system protein ImpG